MPILVPSILENTKQDFLKIHAQEIKLPGVERIQVDFGDGVFVPNKILPVSEVDVINPAFHFEAHLMVKSPENFLDYKIAGFTTIIIHYEAFQSKEHIHQAIKKINSIGLVPALCIKNETPVGVLKDFAGEVKQFQLMSVKPGFQGTSFLDNTYQRIKELREILPNAIIEVDGGVNRNNIKQIAKAGADLIILGSVITKVPNMPEAWSFLKDEINMTISL